jgi:hypothetical protein
MCKPDNLYAGNFCQRTFLPAETSACGHIDHLPIAHAHGHSKHLDQRLKLVKQKVNKYEDYDFPETQVQIVF